MMHPAPHRQPEDHAILQPWTRETRILFWMCVLVAVNQFGFGAMVPSLPLYAQSFGVPASAIGMAVAVYGLARFVVALPSGQLADRFGRRPTIALGGLLSAAGNLWCAVATSYPEFMLARFVAGAGAGFVITTGQVVLADISSPETRGRTISLYQGTFIFAVGIGPFPGGLLAERFGLAAPFWFCGIAALCVAAIAWLAVAETRDLKPLQAGATRPSASLSDQLRLLTTLPGFRLVSVLSLVSAIVRTGGLFAIMPLLANEKLGLSVSRIGFAMMMGSVAGLFTSYPAGWLADRYGRKAVIVPATLLTSVSMLIYCFAPNYAVFMAAAILWGMASSAGATAPAAYAADTAPPGMNAAAMSTFRMMADAGYVIGPILLGIIADIGGASAAMIAGSAMLVAIGIVFGLLAPDSYRGSARN